MKKTFIFLLSYIYSAQVLSDCTNIESLYDVKKIGKREIQLNSNMCYAFALSHALRIISEKYINPIDIAYQFQRFKNPGRNIQFYDMSVGAELEFYDDSFVDTLMAWGYCTKSLSVENELLLDVDKIKQSAKEQNKNYLTLFNELIAMTENQCRDDRFRLNGVRPLFMPVRDEFGRREIDSSKVISAIDTLLKRKTPIVLNTSLKLLGKNSGNHSLLITGSRKKEGRCEYHLLDSLPEAFCESIDSSVQEKNCESGEYWVSAESLETHMISIIGFRKR